MCKVTNGGGVGFGLMSKRQWSYHQPTPTPAKGIGKIQILYSALKIMEKPDLAFLGSPLKLGRRPPRNLTATNCNLKFFNILITLQNIPFEIDDDIEVVPTPGMLPMAVAVVASNTQVGTAAIAGKY